MGSQKSIRSLSNRAARRPLVTARQCVLPKCLRIVAYDTPHGEGSAPRVSERLQHVPTTRHAPPASVSIGLILAGDGACGAEP